MDMNKLQTEIHGLANEKGWWEHGDGPDQLAAKLALVHSEVSEALECLRNEEMTAHTKISGKPDGWPTELADIVIRVLDLAEVTGVDLGAEIQRKHEYNKSRPYRHGGKAL